MDNATRNDLEAKAKRLAYEAAFYAKAMGQDNETTARIIQSMAPKTNWQLSLTNFIEDAIEKDDYTWSRPRRRYIPFDLYLPDLGGSRPPKHIAIGVDVSGSVNERMLEKFLDELTGLIYQNPELTYHIYAVDTKIKSKMKVSVEDMPIKWEVRAGGGTDFRPAFKDIEKEGIAVSGLIYFTDMYCYDYPKEPDYPVMWLNFGPMDFSQESSGLYSDTATWKPPFGEVIDMRD
jgi:predicted metal-dependent peptidase